MSVAQVTLICKNCEKEFSRSKKCANSTKAREWEEWARGNIETCGSCYYKAQREKEKQEPLCAVIRFSTYSAFTDDPSISFVFYGNTYEHKDEIKALGGVWSSDYPGDRGALGDFLMVREPEKRWSIKCSLSNYKELYDKISAFASEIKAPSTSDFAMFRALVEEHRKQETAKQENEDALEKEIKSKIGVEPEYDADIKRILDSKKWNGRVYGKEGKYRIYLSGEETFISDNMKTRLVNIYNARLEWNEAYKKEKTNAATKK